MQDFRLTDHAKKLLKLIQEAEGDWVNRPALARALDKKRLNVWETKLLIDMAEAGLIEMSQRPTSGPAGQEWIYRLPTDEAGVVDYSIYLEYDELEGKIKGRLKPEAFERLRNQQYEAPYSLKIRAIRDDQYPDGVIVMTITEKKDITERQWDRIMRLALTWLKEHGY